jgi:transcriptional regulator with XRE-family HTH domain
MKPANWFSELMNSARKTFTFRLESVILEITEQVVRAMEKKEISRTNLAELLNVSPPAVSKILNGTSNFTVKTLLSLADALDLELHVTLREKKLTAAKPARFDFGKAMLESADAGLSIPAPRTVLDADPFERFAESSAEDMRAGTPNKWEQLKAA